MDDGRKLKFIKEFNNYLEKTLIRCPEGPYKRQLQELFFEIAEASISSTNLLSHNPYETSTFLALFKKENSGFKELVHETDMDLIQVDSIVREHPNLFYKDKGKKVKDFVPIHAQVVKATEALINSFRDNGLPYYKEHGKHPYLFQPEYKTLALEFKKNYRFGIGREYTKLSELITNLFRESDIEKDGRFILENLQFLPDITNFDSRASFYTWKPALETAFKFFIRGIIDHSNLDNNLKYDVQEKFIQIVCCREEEKIHLSFLDCKSIAQRDPEQLKNYFQNTEFYTKTLRSLCDWYVEADHVNNKSFRYNILDSKGNNTVEYIELKEKVGGFKHILEFYDIF